MHNMANFNKSFQGTCNIVKNVKFICSLALYWERYPLLLCDCHSVKIY